MKEEESLRQNNKTLNDRGLTYGPYREGIVIRESILEVILDGYLNHHGEPMPWIYKQFVWDIANKLSRIAVCPTHMDTWHDISGYAQLIEASLKDEGDGR